jgi:predicted phage gp36 major capsid-like protein
MRGEVVDFDLIKIKQKIENRDKPDSVNMREKYIDIRRRRNPRRNVSDLVNEQQKNMEDAKEKIRKSRENIQRAVEEKVQGSKVVSETVETTEPETPRKPVKKIKEDKDIV